MSRRNLWIIGLVCILAGAALGALLWTGPGLTQTNGTEPCPEQITGAIYTTELCGEQVNGNIYTSACGQTDCISEQTDKKGNPLKTGVIVSPYLNGGPRPINGECKGQKLPPGDYYFMVTDPPGKVLLNARKQGQNWIPEDIEQRRFHVGEDGTIDHYYGSTHNDVNDVVGDCGLRISMFDVLNNCQYFRPTPNNGGVYKVWITPVCRFEEAVAGRNDGPNGNGGTGSEAWTLAGFVSRYCKTDVFKVKEKGGKPPQKVLAIFGHKYYDLNANGTWDTNGGQGEPPIPNWRVELWLNGQMLAATCTGEDGSYYFQITDPAAGTYTVKEWLPTSGDWVHTTPDYVDITIPANFDGVITPDNYPNLNFGNVCLTETNCKTKGFWHSPVGAPLVTENLLAGLRNLCLRNADGSGFDPECSAFVNPQNPSPCDANLSLWLVSPVLGNIAHQLSMQLAAFWLNTHAAQQCNNNSMEDPLCCPGTALYAPDSPFADKNGFVSVEDIITMANNLLCCGDKSGCTSTSDNIFPEPGTPVHSQMALLTEFLDNANNNMYEMVAAQPCPFTPDCPPVTAAASLSGKTSKAGKLSFGKKR